MERIRPQGPLSYDWLIGLWPRPHAVTPTSWLFHSHLHRIPVWLTPAGGQRIQDTGTFLAKGKAPGRHPPPQSETYRRL